MRRRALVVGLVTSALVTGAVDASPVAGAQPRAGVDTSVRLAATAWPDVDAGVADPTDTVAVPRSGEVNPIPRRVLGSSGGTRLLLQPDTDGVWWLWWQQGTDAPVRSAQRVYVPATLTASASGSHVVVRDSAGLVSVDLAARTTTKLTLASGWRFVAATPDGYVDFNDTTKVLRRHLGDGSTATIATGVTLSAASLERPAAADATGVAVATGVVRWYPFDGSPSVVVGSDLFSPEHLALSADSVAWTTREWPGNDTDAPVAASVQRAPKAGGSVARFEVAGVTDLAITDDATAWSGTTRPWSPSADTSPRFAAVADAALAHVTSLPATNATSAVAEGDHFLLTDEKPAADAGVYAVTTDATATLQARTTPPLRSVRAFAFDSTRVLEEQLENGAPVMVDRHQVTADGFGPTQFLNLPSTSAPPTLALTAGRMARQGGSATFLDLDSGGGMPSFCCGAGAPAVQQVEASAANAVVGGTVVDMTTGQARFTLPGARTWAVFGDAFAWSTDTGEVWRRTVTTAPVKVVAAACTSGCAAQVGLWGDRLLVQPKTGDLQVNTGSGALLRTLPALPAAEGPWAPALTLEDGVLAWVQPVSGTAGVLRVVDVDAADPTVVDVAQAVRLPGLRAVELRGGRLLWLARDRGLRAAQQPLTRQPRVVPMTLSAPAAFSPHGDGAQDTWTVSGAATAPLAGDVAVEIRRDGTLVRTLTTASRSGRFDLSWDARTASGSAAADGSYTWALRATSADGEPLTALGRPLNGTVVVRRTAPSVVVTAPEVVSSVSTNALFPVRWRPTTTQPDGLAVSYQLQAASRSAGATSWDGWQQWDVGTATSRTFDLRTTFWPTARQWRFRARAVVEGGAVGPWSAYASANIPVDDSTSSATTYSGSWSAQRVSGTYMGTQHRANRYGASVTVSPRIHGRLVRVLVTTCPACGKVQIAVDAGRWLTVDTYSPTVVRRRLVYRSTTAAAFHRVKVRSVASGSRPYVYLDGVVFEP